MDRRGITNDDPFTVLEFYSGIGGMRFSLMHSGIHATIMEAFDINNIANEVYRHNFGHSPCQTNIQSLSSAQLDKYKADAWLLSPPCQPYTRQGLQKDAEDARASSFLKIIQLIPLLLYPPTKLFVENVVGFESSVTHKRMMEVLEKTGFTTQEFILSPLQFGIPYSRPRYFCLAKKAPLSFPRPELNGQLVSSIHPLISGELVPNYRLSLDATFEWTDCTVNEVGLDTHTSCKPIKDFLEADILRRNSNVCMEMDSCRSISENMAIEELDSKLKDCHTKNEFSIVDKKECMVHSRDFYMSEDSDYNAAICEDDSETSAGSKDHSRSPKMEQYSIPVGLIERWGEAMDIVFPDSTRCCCFTKSYGRYIKGTGSFLATVEVDVDGKNMLTETSNKEYESKSKVALLQNLDLRYFTPREVANLHSFPEEFDFPNHFNLRQRYALLGNSLSVAVVAPLLKYLFCE